MFKILAYTTAVALVAFSGTISTLGLMHFVPGHEWAAYTMGALFEVGKLVAVALVVRLPWKYLPLKVALLALVVPMMALNVVGMTGFLSGNFEKELSRTDAVNHTAGAVAQADVDLAERELATAETALADANKQLVAARANKGRQEAATANIAAKTKVRDAASGKLATAKRAAAKTEGSKIESTGEVAMIVVLSEVLQKSVRDAATLVFAGIGCIPELLAGLLMLAAELIGHRADKGPQVVEKIIYVAEPVTVVEPVEVVVEVPVAKIKDPKRVAAGNKGRQTILRKQGEAAGTVVPLPRVKQA